MNNWKASLDRYLTSEPPDDFTPWVEHVLDNYTINMNTEFEDSEIENKWLNYLYDKEYSPKEAARLIEKTYKKIHEIN